MAQFQCSIYLQPWYYETYWSTHILNEVKIVLDISIVVIFSKVFFLWAISSAEVDVCSFISPECNEKQEFVSSEHPYYEKSRSLIISLDILPFIHLVSFLHLPDWPLNDINCSIHSFIIFKLPATSFPLCRYIRSVLPLQRWYLCQWKLALPSSIILSWSIDFDHWFSILDSFSFKQENSPSVQ